MTLPYSLLIVAVTRAPDFLSHLTDAPRREMVAAATAAVVFLSLSASAFASWQLPVIVVLMAAMVGGAGQRRARFLITFPVAILLVSCWWAVAVAPADQQGPTASIAVLFTLYALFLFIDLDLTAFMRWLQWGTVVHAALIFAAGTVGALRPDGFAYNPDPAAGLIVMVLAYRWARRLEPVEVRQSSRIPWVLRIEGALPYLTDALLISAVAHTGSRWSVLIMALIMLAAFVTRRLGLKRALVGGLVSLAITLPSMGNVVDSQRVFERNPVADAVRRSEIVVTPSLVPHGLMPSAAMHQAAVRVAVEFGLVAGIAWAWLGFAAMWRLRRHPAAWTMGAMLVLGVADYYMVLAMLLPLWWVVVTSLKPRGGFEPPR